MTETDENPRQAIDETEREADQELDQLEQTGQDMEERLEEAGDEAGEVNVPDPAESPEPGVDETDVPEGEGESAGEAGQ